MNTHKHTFTELSRSGTKPFLQGFAHAWYQNGEIDRAIFRHFSFVDDKDLPIGTPYNATLKQAGLLFG